MGEWIEFCARPKRNEGERERSRRQEEGTAKVGGWREGVIKEKDTMQGFGETAEWESLNEERERWRRGGEEEEEEEERAGKSEREKGRWRENRAIHPCLWRRTQSEFRITHSKRRLHFVPQHLCQSLLQLPSGWDTSRIP